MTSVNDIKAELDRLHGMIEVATEPGAFEQLYAAQQALAWVLEYGGAPSNVIADGKVYAPEHLPLVSGVPNGAMGAQ